ncbi:MAG TPA: zf-HC2 domain-containing protein [Gemmatimonadaceae bacterium]|nr:zf-HC2 domain-containing protein [Gemmatimonadaceae bacterium]
MRDCPNVEMRERLPELLHGRLPGDVDASVRQHVAGCPDCAAELELLRRVRDGWTAPTVDIERIVAAIPPYAPAVQGAVTRARKAGSPPWLKIAAAIVLVAGLAGLWTMLRRASGPDVEPNIATRGVESGAPRVAPPVRSVAQTSVTQLSVGEPLSDLSDSDLRALAETVADLDAVPSTDVESLDPSFIDIEGDS